MKARKKRILGLAVFTGCVLITVGIWSMPKGKVKLSTDRRKTVERLDSLFPTGMPKNDIDRFLTDDGFEVTDCINSGFSEEWRGLNVFTDVENANFLYTSKMENCLIGANRWQLAFEYDENKRLVKVYVSYHKL